MQIGSEHVHHLRFHDTSRHRRSHRLPDLKPFPVPCSGDPTGCGHTDEDWEGPFLEDPLHAVGASRWFLATETNEPVGIVVSTRKEGGVEIGYWASPDHWGRGIAGAMVDCALATIPEFYGTRKLIARVGPANAASAKLLTRRGFQAENRA